MAKVPIALRLQPETLDWLDGYARSRGSSRQVILEAAVESLREDVLGGVPDLPPEPKPSPAVRSRPVVKPVPGVRPAREFVLNPRQARLNRARES